MSLTVTTPRHVLRVADLSADELGRVLALAARMKAEPSAWTGAFPGRALATVFEQPSAHTRASFAVAAHRLGMLPLELELGGGETVADTARVISGYAAAVAVHGVAQATVDEFAAHATVPVINALSDIHHPCQALADLLTLKEHFAGRHGLELAYVGDGNNVAHSLLEACALAGVSMSVATPPGHEPDGEVIDRAFHLQADHGGFLEVTHDPFHAVAGAHGVYADDWVSMGDERERTARFGALADYRVTPELMELAATNAIFLHCLPAHRGEEVDAAVIDGLQSAVWEQAANFVPTAQALIYSLITGDWDGAP
jgi:ornithine carbamoyltransferase